MAFPHAKNLLSYVKSFKTKYFIRKGFLKKIFQKIWSKSIQQLRSIKFNSTVIPSIKDNLKCLENEMQLLTL